MTGSAGTGSAAGSEPITPNAKKVRREQGPDSKELETPAPKPCSALSRIWKKHQKQLLKEAPLGSSTWLTWEGEGFSCLACKGVVSGPWASGSAVRGEEALGRVLWYIRRHAQSKTHCQAVKKVLGVNSYDEELGAPSVHQFSTLFKRLKDGDSLRNCNEFKQSSDKTNLMAWCLAEALAEADRVFFRKATTMSLARDARRQRLVIRWGASTSGLMAASGLLGVARDFGDRSIDIVHATEKILRDACTQFLAPPRYYEGPPPQLQEDLYQHLQAIVEVLVTDAASNELVAGEMGRGRRPRPDCHQDEDIPVLLPRVLMLARDAAHSFRRVLTRPYLADEVLTSVMESYILSKHSPCQIIWHSTHFSALLDSWVFTGLFSF
ncbi:unnamed protein product [Symbiodinium necroappetens]|uniref:Uncharacterized protein n=1 Tax=Symbiodinium necroappetens TaxID=1628268 RepID=A0A812W7T5_9DINO|nr:unnamed protein product [Symbiodinium necroappetens]